MSKNSKTAAMPPPGVCMNIINARHKKDGLGTVADPERFLNQDYQQLKQFCLTRGVRYIDEMLYLSYPFSVSYDHTR